MTNVVGYARFSSNNQSESSIEAQEREIKTYAEVNGYNLIKVYSDYALSGQSDDRPEFQKMIRDSRTGFFQKAIVHKYDRFARDIADAVLYERELQENGVKLVSVEEQINNGTPEGNLMKTVLMGMNDFYSQNLAREVMKGLKTNAYKCLHTGGTPALGYEVNDDLTYRINEHEAQAVHIIFERYAAGFSYGDIIDELNNKGYKTKAGNNFGRNSLHAILKRERYMGTYVYNKVPAKDYRGKVNSHASKPEEEIIRIEDGVPAIVSKELFEEVQKRMKENKRRSGQHSAVHRYLLSGLVHCAECNTAMIGQRNNNGYKTYYYYRCNGNTKRSCTAGLVQAEALEEEVLFQVNEILFNEERAESIYRKIQDIKANENNSNAKLKLLNKELREVKKKIENGTNAILEGIDYPQLRNEIDQLIERKRNIKINIIELESAKDDNSLEDIKSKYANDIKIEKLPVIQQQAILQKILKGVVVYPEKNKKRPIEIILNDNNPSKSLTDYVSFNGSAESSPMKNTQPNTANGYIFIPSFICLDR